MRISMKEIWRNLDGPQKNKELWSYVGTFEFSRPKSSSEMGRCGSFLYRFFFFNIGLYIRLLKYVQCLMRKS